MSLLIIVFSLFALLRPFTTTFSRFAQTIDYTWTTLINNKFFTIVLQDKLWAEPI